MTSAMWRLRTLSMPVGPGRLSSGFTLIEVCLTLTVLALLMGILVVSLPALGTSQLLEEGAGRFETVVHMARADAASLGRKLRLSFDSDEDGAGKISLLWETDPLTEPRVFSPYTACTWEHHVPNGLVQVTGCTLRGTQAFGRAEMLQSDEASDDVAELETVTFYPDGSCDSAYITLVAADAEDPRTAVIEIEGLSGLVTRRILTPDELAEEEDQAEGQVQ